MSMLLVEDVVLDVVVDVDELVEVVRVVDVEELVDVVRDVDVEELVDVVRVVDVEELVDVVREVEVEELVDVVRVVEVDVEVVLVDVELVESSRSKGRRWSTIELVVVVCRGRGDRGCQRRATKARQPPSKDRPFSVGCI